MSSPSVGLGAVGEVEVDLAVVLRAEPVLAALALAQLAVLEHRGVVRRVAHLGVDLVERRTAAPRRLGWDSVGLAPRRSELPAQQPIAELAQPGRHLVDGRRGDDEHAEERRAARAAARRRTAAGAGRVSRLGDDEADRTTGLLEVAGVTGDRAAGEPLAMCTMPSTPNSERGPADHLASGRTVALGVAQVAPRRRSTRSSGTNQRDQADGARPRRCAGRRRARRAAATRQRRRRPRPDRPGRARHRRGGAPARDRAPCWPIRRTAAPTAWARPSQIAATPRPSAENPRRPVRARTGPPVVPAVGTRTCGVASSSSYSGNARPRCCAPSTTVRTIERRQLLLREPGGEDVRVAMVRNLGHCHSSHTDHTPHRAPACHDRRWRFSGGRAARGGTTPGRRAGSPR